MNRFRLFGAIPLIFIISLIGCVVVGIILRYTQIGRRFLPLVPMKRQPSCPVSR